MQFGKKDVGVISLKNSESSADKGVKDGDCASWTFQNRTTVTNMAASEKAVERWAALESNPEVLPVLLL